MKNFNGNLVRFLVNLVDQIRRDTNIINQREQKCCRLCSNVNSNFFLGPNNSFVNIYKGNETSLEIDKTVADLPVGKQVQFRACAINLIGAGPWGFPYGIKIPE